MAHADEILALLDAERRQPYALKEEKMPKIVPDARPALTRKDALQHARRYTADLCAYRCFLLGIRGYYRRTMGDPARNDRGIYDDTICLITPDTIYTYNANVDPSVYRKWIAVLQPGFYLYKIGTHGWNKPLSRRYKALIQASEVRVSRDQDGIDQGWFGINIHKGTATTTSSAGCQTIHPKQWPEFIQTVEFELGKHEMTRIPYVLVEG